MQRTGWAVVLFVEACAAHGGPPPQGHDQPPPLAFAPVVNWPDYGDAGPPCDRCFFEMQGQCREPGFEIECNPACCTRPVPAPDGGTTLAGYQSRDCKGCSRYLLDEANACVSWATFGCGIASCGEPLLCDPSCCSSGDAGAARR
jgi:hypothetical protein